MTDDLTTTKTLPVPLRPDELAERAQSLAAAVAERDAKEEHRKQRAKALKEEVDDVTAQVQHLARVVRDREEARQVECRWDPNHRDRTMELYRLDTGERVDCRPMKPDEIKRYLNHDLFEAGPRPDGPEAGH